MNFLRSFDWLTLIVYVILVLVGWVTINAASYNFDGASIFDFSRPSGKQIVWFGLALFLIIAILCLDSRFYMSYAPLIYVSVMILLFVTIFIGTNINGSHSWIKIGTFSIQPAEFGKFSTALMLAYLFNGYNFKFTEPANFAKACMIVLIPVLLIILQNETGSALVYFSLVLLFYRQGMSGIILWAGFCFILIFVLGIKYSVEPLPEGVVLGLDESAPPSLKGQNLVLTIIPFLVAGMLAFFANNYGAAGFVALVAFLGFGLFGLLDHFITWPFPFQYRWIGWIINLFTVGYCAFLFLLHKPLLSMYSLTETAYVMADQLLVLMAFLMVTMGYMMPVMNGILRGGGDAKFTLYVNMISTWAVVVPLSFISAFVWKLPVVWVVFFSQSDQVFKAPIAFLRFRTYKWVKKLTRET